MGTSLLGISLMLLKLQSSSRSLGMMNAQGCTFCCHIALYVRPVDMCEMLTPCALQLYVLMMGALSLAGLAFVIAAAVKKVRMDTSSGRKRNTYTVFMSHRVTGSKKWQRSIQMVWLT